MGTVEDLEVILERIERSPLNVARTEIEMFRRTLEQDPIFFTVIDKVIQTEQAVLGAKAATLAKDPQHSAWADLSFANTPPLRAVVGYQVCVCLLESYKKPDEFGNRLMDGPWPLLFRSSRLKRTKSLIFGLHESVCGGLPRTTRRLSEEWFEY